MTKKQELNGYYCLATKEHYEQLVKDGYKGTSFDGHRYIKLDDGYFTFSDIIINHKPIHYHNGQWHFGSLEHEEFDRMFNEASERVNEFQLSNEPKPSKRITKEEALSLCEDIRDYAEHSATRYPDKIADKLIEYINQKDAV